MKTWRLLILIGVILLYFQQIVLGQGQTTYFSRIHDIHGIGFPDMGYDAHVVDSSTYIVCSLSLATAAGDTSGFPFIHPSLLKYNNQGGLQDSFFFKRAFEDLVVLSNRSFIPTLDGGYAIGGTWMWWLPGYTDSYYGRFILKLDANLDSTWIALDSGSMVLNQGMSVAGMVQTPDGGYVISGGDLQSRMTFTRYDALGNKLWHKVPFSLGNSLVKSFHALSTGEFFLCGMKAGRAYVAVLDDNCDVVWERNFEFDAMNTNVACGVPRKGGGFFFGYYRLDELYPQFADMEFTWFSHNLKVTHSQRLCIPRDQWIQEVIELEDGSIVVSGRTGDVPGGNNADRSFLLKFSPSGELLWFNKYHWYAAGMNINNDVCSTPDGGFLLAGHTWDSTGTSPYSDTWVLKVDSVGCPFPGCTPGTWAEEAEDEAADVVAWPNPASHILHFRNEGDLYEAGTLTLFSPEGKVLEQILMPQGFQETSLELGHLPQGTYFWQYTRASGAHSAGKVMVRR